MPFHRVVQGENPAQALADAHAALTKAGERVLYFEPWGNEWLVLTEFPVRPLHPDRPADIKERSGHER